MSQARRKRGKTPSRQKGASSHGFGMFAAGLVVGAVAASFFIGLSSNDPESIGRGIEHMIAASKSRFQEQAVPPPSAPENKASTEFDFYMLLPEIEHVVPEDPPAVKPEEVAGPPQDDVARVEQQAAAEPVPATDPPPAASPAAGSTSPSGESRYELQAGAFVRMADADRLKAELALKGLSARIQKVSIQGRGDFFRVRLGPYTSTTELESADRQLAALGIDALRLKISGG